MAPSGWTKKDACLAAWPEQSFCGRASVTTAGGPELVWYGPADTYCVRCYRFHLTERYVETSILANV